MIRKCAVLVCVSMLMFSGSASGADKALIIGVGEYAKETVSDLEGIDIDVEMMLGAAQMLGFERENIMVLQDEQATFSGVVDAMLDWLPAGVARGDRILIYFSGHGASFPDTSGDEKSDGQDEVLVLHDADLEGQYNGVTTHGYLWDETFGALLGQIPSENIVVLIDACHSGTPTRSLAGVPKYFGDASTSPKYVRPSLGSPGFGERVVLRGLGAKAATDRYVALSAAKDDEVAIATSKGSLFTHSISRSIRSALQENRSITPAQMIQEAREFVRAIVPEEDRYTPQLTGNEVRFGKPLSVLSMNNGASETPGTVWEKISQSADEMMRNHGKIQLSTNETDYRLGQNVEITVNVPATGYLNVVTVDSRDNATVLFPNKYNQDNQVRAGQLRIPTQQMDFKLPVVEPVGQALVVAFLSDSPINLYESNVGGTRDANGKFTDVFAELSAVGTRAIAVAQKERPSGWMRANKIVVSTRQ